MSVIIPNLQGHYTSLTATDFARLGLLAAIWGASFIAMRIAVPEMGALLAADLRICLAALILFIFAKLKHIQINWRRNFRVYFLAGLFGAVLPFTLLSYAAHLLPAALLALLNATCPLFGAIFSALWLKESLSLCKLAGLVLGFGGVWLMVGGSAALECSPTLLAVSASILGPACFAIAGVLIKHHTCVHRAASDRISPLAMATGAMLAACLIVLPGLPFLIPSHLPSATSIGAVIALALFPSALAQILFIPLIARIGPTRAMSVSFLIPFFSMLWGFIFLHEAIGFDCLLGGAIVLAATALVMQSGQATSSRLQSISSNHPV